MGNADELTTAEDITELETPEFSPRTVGLVIDKMLVVVDELSGRPLRSYQIPLARRILEALITQDSTTLTALWSRQSGKTETIVDTISAAMLMLPRLVPMFPNLLDHFKHGVWVGAFAPTDEQAETIYSRFTDRLTSDRAIELMADPELSETVKGRGKEIRLKKSGSLVRKQTAHPRAKIEGKTYHIALIDEAQDCDERVVNKSIAPMMASTGGTIVMTGTPNYTKGTFYKTIQSNKRKQNRRGVKQCHFEADWRSVAKDHTIYGRYIQSEKLRIGEDSDEFMLSYKLVWLLDRGMFTTSEQFDRLCDQTMQTVKGWHHTPVVVGIDPARKQDSTIVTVVFVDWDHPDEFGQYEHRVLNWLDLSGMEWEEQFHQIVEFLSAYRMYAVAVDSGGVGDVVASRLRVMMPGIEIVDAKSDVGSQSTRFKHVIDLMRNDRIVFPGHSKAKRLKVWKRFQQEMTDAELEFRGPNVLVAAPEEVNAHDDYVDSLALACMVTQEMTMPEVQQSDNFFYH